MKKFEEIYAPATEPITIANNANQALLKNHREWREAFHAVKVQNRELVDENKEFERENQRLRAENLAVKTLVEDAKKQQPEIPECVAKLIEERGVPEDGEFRNYIVDGGEHDKAIDWINTHQRTWLLALLNCYTVTKEKRFYLKHKSVLIFDPDSDDSDVDELYLGAGGNFVPYQHLAKIFTQQEIDSMETGSYEQIEVEEVN